MSHSVESLGAEREARLAALEETIGAGLRAFIRVGEALTEIRDEQLYQGHESFEVYCKERWEMSRSQAYRLIDAAAIAKVVTSPNGDTLPPPATEAQARALTPLKADPDRVREVWGDVVQQHGDRAPADAVREAVEAARGPKPPPPTREPKQTPLTGSERAWQLIEGDIAGAEAVIDSGSVEAVVTQPPFFTPETEPEYEALLALAARALVEGGSLAILSRQTELQDLLALIGEYPQLKYRWTLALTVEETSVWSPHVRTTWQPVVWATQGNYRGDWVDDRVEALGTLIERLTGPTRKVLDPFCGVGVIGEATINAGRDFIGVEGDPVALAEATRRRDALV